MVVFSFSIMPHFEYHRTQAAGGPPNCTKLLRIITSLVNQICLIENPDRFLEADAMLSLDIRTFFRIKFTPRI